MEKSVMVPVQIQKENMRLLHQEPRTVTFCLTWDVDISKTHVVTIPVKDVIRGKDLCEAVAKRLSLSADEVTLQQKRARTIIDDKLVVFTAEGKYATSTGKVVLDTEIHKKEWKAIRNKDEVHLAGSLDLHLMFNVTALSSKSSTSEVDGKDRKD